MNWLSPHGRTRRRALAGLRDLKTLYATELPVKDHDVANGWAAFVDGAADRERAMRALEMLIPEEQWKAQRRRHLSLLRLPENPKEYLTSLVAAAKRGIVAVSQAVARGEIRSSRLTSACPS
jgi:hypothetical protein